MNLKEAFRFQNKLQALLDTAIRPLESDDNVLTIKATHLRKKVMPEAENETILRKAPSEYADRVNELMAFLLYLLKQKELLAKAIRQTKNTLPFDLDSESSLNTTRHSLRSVFEHLVDLRSSETTISGGGSGYRFNAEGNQVTYRCDVREVTTINFDRHTARKYLSALNHRADAMSVEIDRCLINYTVDYFPPFDVNDSFAEVFDNFCEQTSNA